MTWKEKSMIVNCHYVLQTAVHIEIVSFLNVYNEKLDMERNKNIVVFLVSMFAD